MGDNQKLDTFKNYKVKFSKIHCMYIGYDYVSDSMSG